MSDYETDPIHKGRDASKRQKPGVVRELHPAGAGTGHGPQPEIAPQVRESLDILSEACGSNLVAVVFFGSVLVGTSPTADSAADLFVIVEDYWAFYRDIHIRLPAARRASIMAALNRIMPPNIIYLRDPGDLRGGAKCFVISREDFGKALSPDARDHFCRGRLVQRFQIVYSRSIREREQIEEEIETARRVSVEWVPVYLPERFTVLEFCLRMLDVSYAGEIRPESQARVREVFDAQRSYFTLMYGRILEEAVGEGRLRRIDGGYCLTKPPGISDRLYWRVFFAKSKVRATLRWAKYMLTFEDWLDYIARKAERRTGVHLELTKAERRLPALLLWPKLFKVLNAMRPRRKRSRPAGEDKPSSNGNPI
ncbi:MAG: hypothetical protein JSW58_11055 [Candidatus Latescibacterota bacterium]|nr:MAG: hypothetical protein JSW58_11055 [Candidatus Latescibacterota bacterium]